VLLCCLRHNVKVSCHDSWTLCRRPPPSRSFAAYQRLVSSTCHGTSLLSVLHLAVDAFTACDGAKYWLRWRFLPTPPAFNAPVRGCPSKYCHDVWYGKTKMVWLTDGEKFWRRYIYSFWRNVWTWQTPHDGIGSACIASRSNQNAPVLLTVKQYCFHKIKTEMQSKYKTAS